MTSAIFLCKLITDYWGIKLKSKAMRKYLFLFIFLLSSLLYTTCQSDKSETKETIETKGKQLLSNYAEVKLNPDLSSLSDNQKECLKYLIKASAIVDDIYWAQTCGDREELKKADIDPELFEYVKINYGPWDRLNGMKPFVESFNKRPEGANYYPKNMTFLEFDEFEDPDKFNCYTIIRRNEVGGLQTIPYHKAYKDKLLEISALVKKAAAYAENESFKNYLNLCAKALLNDDYKTSNIEWMKMKDNDIDLIMGPIDDSDDKLFFTRKAYQSLVLLRDAKLSKELEKYALLIRYLQKSLPVESKYITDVPGELSDIMVYDVVYTAGFLNAGSKKIAMTLPVDESIQVDIGSRRLQFKNVLQAKFDKILKPISDELIDKNQQKHVTFNAFVENTMFYEIGSVLGISTTINGDPVREALKDYYYVIEESKNDILSLFFITKLYEMGEITTGDLTDNYITYMADIFRSVRFGISNDQGVANIIRFYFFEEKGAFSYDKKTGRYKVNVEKMKEVMREYAQEILLIQGEGDYESASKLVEEKGYIRDVLLQDLYRLQKENIPKDIVFKQGLEVLQLE